MESGSLDNEIPSTALALTFMQECFWAIKRQKVPFSLKLVKPVISSYARFTSRTKSIMF